MSGDKIRVLHVTGCMNRGGAEVMLMDIYRNISNDIHFDFLVHYKLNSGIKAGDFDDEIVRRGARIRHIASQWDLGLFKYINQFEEVIRDLGKPHIVHIHMNSKSGVIALAAKKTGINTVIVHSHANLTIRGSLWTRLLGKLELVFQKKLMSVAADQFWGCSHEASESLFYKRLLSPEKCTIINNAVDIDSLQNVSTRKVEELRASYGINPGTVVLGNVGRVVKHKNVLFLIEVLRVLDREDRDYVLVFAGRDEDTDYLNDIFLKSKQYQIEHRVKYLGVRDDIGVVMSSFDCFLGPALKEGFGLVAVESQAVGLPTILYKGFPKTVDMNVNLVTFINSLDPYKWANLILNVPKRKSELEQIKNALITNGFDSASNAANIERRYKELIK